MIHDNQVVTPGTFTPDAPIPPDFSDPIQYHLPYDLRDGDYYWRVWAWHPPDLNFDSTSESSLCANPDVRHFIIDTQAPQLSDSLHIGHADGCDCAPYWIKPHLRDSLSCQINFTDAHADTLRVTVSRAGAMTDSVIVTEPTSAMWLQIPVRNKADGIYTLSIECIDCAGNHAAITDTFGIDGTPPQGYHSDLPEHCTNAPYWARILNAADSGAGGVRIFLDTSWQCATPPISERDSMPGLITPGWHYYRYYAEDCVCNRGDTLCDSVYIDQTLPALTMLHPVDRTDNDTIQLACDTVVLFEITDSDGAIDTAGISFQVNGTRYRRGSSSVATWGDCFHYYVEYRGVWQEGDNRVRIDSIRDLAGNIAVGDSLVEFILDRTGPQILAFAPALSSVALPLPFDVSFTIEDNGIFPVAETLIVSFADTTIRVPGHDYRLDSLYRNDPITLQAWAGEMVTPDYCQSRVAFDSLSFIYAGEGIPDECLAHPDPFTPNGDGINDVAIFEFPNKRTATDKLEILIFDIQGHQVRVITDQDTWDGRDENDKLMANNIYFYILKLDGKTVCKGALHLIR